MAICWTLTKPNDATVTCLSSTLLDGVDVQVTYGGLLVGRHTTTDEAEGLIWAERCRIEWLSHGWTDSEADNRRSADAA
jgi:hypothetical protein